MWSNIVDVAIHQMNDSLMHACAERKIKQNLMLFHYVIVCV